MNAAGKVMIAEVEEIVEGSTQRELLDLTEATQLVKKRLSKHRNLLTYNYCICLSY